MGLQLWKGLWSRVSWSTRPQVLCRPPARPTLGSRERLHVLVSGLSVSPFPKALSPKHYAVAPHFGPTSGEQTHRSTLHVGPQSPLFPHLGSLGLCAARPAPTGGP